eukprot:GHVU01073245.1.p1 GENE.GHVU01073245.1~~GHVU01073245.1.p1  ORF type:complete len:201 (+),score=34.33 GHVU01073245.1:303-905(+)
MFTRSAVGSNLWKLAGLSAAAGALWYFTREKKARQLTEEELLQILNETAEGVYPSFSVMARAFGAVPLKVRDMWSEERIHMRPWAQATTLLKRKQEVARRHNVDPAAVDEATLPVVRVRVAGMRQMIKDVVRGELPIIPGRRIPPNLTMTCSRRIRRHRPRNIRPPMTLVVARQTRIRRQGGRKPMKEWTWSQSGTSLNT